MSKFALRLLPFNRVSCPIQFRLISTKTGDKSLHCVLTVRDGKIVWDSEGLSVTDWENAGPYSNFR